MVGKGSTTDPHLQLRLCPKKARKEERKGRKEPCPQETITILGGGGRKVTAKEIGNKDMRETLCYMGLKML